MENAKGSLAIKMNELKDLTQSLVDFLKERVGLDVTVQNDTLIVSKGDGEEVSARRLKVYLKRFLHSEKLRGKYRILVKSGEINFVKLKEED